MFWFIKWNIPTLKMLMNFLFLFSYNLFRICSKTESEIDHDCFWLSQKYVFTFYFQEQLRKNDVIIDVLKTEEGVLALCIVQEFLEFCNLKFTNTVLESEVGSQTKSRSHQQLVNDLKLKQDNSKVPVLCQLLETILSNSQQPSNSIRSQSSNHVVRIFFNNIRIKRKQQWKTLEIMLCLCCHSKSI